MNTLSGLNGYNLFGKESARKLDGWRKIMRDERALVRLILLNLGTLRDYGRAKMDLSLSDPEWSTFKTTEYYREMAQYLDGRMLEKFAAWWELLRTIRAGNQSKAQLERTGVAMGCLLAESVRRKGGRDMDISLLRNGIPLEEAEVIRGKVISQFELLIRK